MQLTEAQREALKAFKESLKQQPENVEFSQEGEYYYIPISYLEQDLNLVFDWVQFEIKSIQELINTITVSVRLKVLHPILGEWIHYDGAATIALADGKYNGTTAMIKQGEEYRFTTLAIAYAKQNAAKSIGPRFGANLNREITPEGKTAFDVIPFDKSTIKTKLDVLKAIAGGYLTKEEGDEIISNNYVHSDVYIDLKKSEKISDFSFYNIIDNSLSGNTYFQNDDLNVTVGANQQLPIPDKKTNRKTKSTKK